MSTNGQLVFTDVDKITFKGVGNTSNAVVDTVTGKIGVGIDSPDANLHILGNSYVSTNLELGGTLIMGTVNVEAQHSLEAITATGNTTPVTVEFQNTDTSLVASGNVEVGNDLIVSGNVEVGLPKQYQKLVANDGATGDYFGSSVSIDGDTMVIGAYADDDDGPSSGSAYVFTRTNGIWTQIAKLTTSDAAASDYFGFSVSIDGDTILISAYFDDDNGSASGSAYVFTRNTAGDLTSGWTQRAKLTASDAAANDQFGRSVSINGDTVVIGAFCDDDNGVDSGSAYVFTRNTAGDLTSGWTQRAKLTANDGVADDNFGMSVAINGDTVVIGAYKDDDDGPQSGSAYVFTRDTAGDLTSGWTQRAKLTAGINGAASDYFGWSVSIDGDTAVIGAYGDGSSIGSAYVFTRDTAGDLTSSWTQVAKLTANDGAVNDYFGYRVSINGDTMVIGAYGDDDNGSASGSAYVFMRSTASWTQVAKLTANDGAAGDNFGSSVSIDGNTIVIGARYDGSYSGSVYTFSTLVIKDITITGNATVARELTVTGNMEVGTANLFVDTTNSRIGIGTSSPGEKLHVNGDIRLGASANNTADDNTNRTISTAGQLFIKANDSDLDGTYTNMILQAGNTNPGKIVIGGNDGAAYGTPSSQIEFFTPGATAAVCKIEPGGFLLPKAFAFMASGSGGTFTNVKPLMKDISTFTQHFDYHPNPNGIYRGLREQSNDGNRGIYFAPVKGVYHFSCKSRIPDNNTSTYEIEWYIKRNGSHSSPYSEVKYTSYEMWASPGDGGGRRSMMSSSIVKLDVDEGFFPRNDGTSVSCSQVTFGGYFLGTYD